MMPNKIYIPFLFFIILTQFSCEKNYVEPAGLLDGFSFETEPIQFSSYSNFRDDYTLLWTDEEAFDGTSSLRITSNQKGNQSFAFWSLSYSDFKLNQSLKVKVRVKTVDFEGDSGVAVNMFARSEDRMRNITSAIGAKINTNGQWETIEVSLENNPNSSVGVVDIYLLFPASSTGTVYWDKLEIFTGE